MRLSEVRGRHTTRQERQSPQEELGVIRNIAVYPRPIDALYLGQPVTLIATGDVVGMSPAAQIVDETGRIDWVSLEELTVTHREFLPQNEQITNRLRQAHQTQHQ